MKQKTKLRLIVLGVEIPIRRGCCTKLFITGSRETGYVLEVGGFTNWLIH